MKATSGYTNNLINIKNINDKNNVINIWKEVIRRK